jgi:hypothetical protein
MLRHLEVTKQKAVANEVKTSDYKMKMRRTDFVRSMLSRHDKRLA